MAHALDAPVTQLPTVRGRVARGLVRLRLETVRHLLFHFPTRHEDRRMVTPIVRAAPGTPVVIRGTITAMTMEEAFRRRGGQTRRVTLTRATVRDESGELPVRWYHQRYLEKQYPAGTPVVLVGFVTSGEEGPTLIAPELERATAGKTLLHACRLVPVYPETNGVTSRQLRFLVSRALPLAAELTEYLPDATRIEEELLGIVDAIRAIHFPESPEMLAAARRRLSFDELFLYQLAAFVRRALRTGEHSVPLPTSEATIADAVTSLPFPLTSSQVAALRVILDDVRRDEPMVRLLAGDVGSGKTVVAGLAALAVARTGGQTAFAAPTELLALQHAGSLRELLEPAGLRVACLTGSTEARARADMLTSIADGTVTCLVGTHALFHAPLTFRNLALVVVDEQQRFGVEQRAELTRRGPSGTTPHFLSLTATPIPRTLQLTAFGDVDVTPLSPRPGQQVIRTDIVTPDRRNTVTASLANTMRAGGQVFVVCPRVEEGEDDTRTVVSEYERLRRDVFPTFRLGILHGKLTTEEKEQTIGAFREHALDLLVASSIVEVGVDIPDAAALLVESAERFGLAQLHQLRGRIGRRGQTAVCYLAAAEESGAALDRLRVLEGLTNGLDIAEEDLRRRGSGEIYGTRQSGGMRLRIANLADIDFLLRVRRAAEALLTRDPALSSAPLVARRIEQLNVTTHFE